MATGSPAAPVSQLDIVFDGTWVILPRVDGANRINGLDVYSPACGHPQGVLFISGLNPNPWPNSTAFYMLDSHGHTLSIQRSGGRQAGMNVRGIDTSNNHCLAKARPIGNNWDLLVSISAGPDLWTSTGTLTPTTTDLFGNTVHCFSGKDAPTGNISSTQTLSFQAVEAVDLCGAPANVQALLPAPWNGQGSLIFEDEIPYIPTLQHERAAILSLADLAGVDLSLDFPLAKKSAGMPASAARPQLHTGGYCGYSLIVMP